MSEQVAIYARISMDRAGQGLGVERQEQDCRALADRLGWSVARVFVDNDVSAYSGKRRPEYEALLDDVAAGKIDAVLAWHPDRLHRSPKELERYIDLTVQHGVETATVQAGAWDLSTPSGRAVARTLGAWARYESEHKSERVKRAARQRAESGRNNGGSRAYGYEKGGTEIRESEAAEIRKACEQIVAGVSLRQIVRDLNGRNVATTTGRGRWTGNRLRQTLTAPRIAGLSAHHGEVVGCGKWPGVIGEDTWRAVQAVLNDPSRRMNAGRGAVPRWLGSGVYVCGVCGQRRMRAGSGGGGRGRHHYRCAVGDEDGAAHVTRSAERLDEYVEETVVERLSEPGVLDALLEHNAPDTTPVRHELAALRGRQVEAAESFADGVITAQQLGAITAKLEVRIAELESQLVTAGRRSPLDALAGAEELRTRWFGTDAERTDGLRVGQRRTILNALVTVTVLPVPRGRGPNGAYFDPNGVRIDWHAG